MKHSGLAVSARRMIILIGKYLPFLFIIIVAISNLETLHSYLTGRYAMYNGESIYYKPISWWIGDRIELSMSWICVMSVLSVGVETCIWNRISIGYLTAVLLQKEFFLNHTIDEDMFACILLVNIIISLFLIFKSLHHEQTKT